MLLPLFVALVTGDPDPVPPPRVDTTVTVDGRLDEPVWARAQPLRGFTQYRPVDGPAAHDSTVILVWYSPRAMHFGIRAFERHGAVRATLPERDKVDSDDHLYLVLDTFNDRRQAYAIGVNPFGVQSDGILRDADRRTNLLDTGEGDAGYTIDLNPDFLYESQGRLTTFGFEIEVRVPFASLRFRRADEQSWGLNVVRRVQHSGYEDTWRPVRRSDPSFLAASGLLTGLTGLQAGLVLDLNPEMTSAIDGSSQASGWSYDARRPQLGGNLRWGITNDVFLNGTVNPDFSQIEADVAQVQYDPRQALFFPEKRPFFLDGLEQFDTQNRLIYTRRLADPTAAVKLTGRVRRTSLAFLSGVDSRDLSRTDTRPVFNWVRVRHDAFGQSTLGMAYTDKIDGDDFNRVAAADARLVLGAYSLQLQAGGSVTRRAASTVAAPLWDARVSRAGRRFGFTSNLTGFHPDFETESGFISRVGVVRANFTPRFTFYPRPGSLVESWTGSVTFDGTWEYDRFMRGTSPNDSKLHFNGSFAIRGGWRLSASLLVESFRYPAELYTEYFIERRTGSAVDTIPYVGTNRFSNLDLVVSVATPRLATFSGSGFLIVGRDENFFEWAPADIIIGSVTGDWRPTEQLRVNLQYQHTQYIRPSDNSTVGLRRIPRVKAEYQLSRAIFVRVVAQYDADFRDALRDNSRTEDPILIRDPRTGTFARALARTRNDLRVDWLFSYRPNPGTVFFAGYGSTMSEPESFRFRQLDRRSDGFFVKASYLWRM